jgi:hypothetical protein
MMREDTDRLVSVNRDPPSRWAHAMSVVFILGGAVVCLPFAAWFGMYLGLHPYRMVCTPETGYGSGCYEGELLFALIIAAAVFSVCAVFGSILTKLFRYDLPPRRMWWPFLVFCGLVIGVAAIIAVIFVLGPRQYP